MQQLDSTTNSSFLMVPFSTEQEGAVPPASSYRLKPTDHQLGIVLSNVLRYGVLLACAIVLVGGLLYLIRHGAEPVSYHVFQGESAVFCSPIGVIQAVLGGRSRGIVQLGLMVLMATPMVRVAVAWLTFLKQRDRLYCLLTSLVLAGLLYSFLGAYV
jgi:uncharacterized membrane protein